MQLKIFNLKLNNMYTTPILWMLSWPVLIVVSYQLVKLAVKKYESKLEAQEKDSE